MENHHQKRVLLLVSYGAIGVVVVWFLGVVMEEVVESRPAALRPAPRHRRLVQILGSPCCPSVPRGTKRRSRRASSMFGTSKSMER